jgi:ubiquinone/menaquinone biosynthesis C-methylase UbiE
MAGYEPPLVGIILVPPLMRLVLGRYYGRRVHSLGLMGDERVLDFGAGPGVAALHFARALSKGEGRLTWVDVSQGWMEAAQRTLRTLDLEDDAYDLVFIHFVLHDVSKSDRPGVVHHLARVLRPGGKVILREPTSKDHGIAPSELRSLMNNAGLQETYLQTRRLLLIQPVCDAGYRKTQ